MRASSLRYAILVLGVFVAMLNLTMALSMSLPWPNGRYVAVGMASLYVLLTVILFNQYRRQVPFRFKLWMLMVGIVLVAVWAMLVRLTLPFSPIAIEARVKAHGHAFDARMCRDESAIWAKTAQEYDSGRSESDREFVEYMQARARAAEQRALYHEALDRKYQAHARDPRLPVTPDPPEPRGFPSFESWKQGLSAPRPGEDEREAVRPAEPHR